MLAKASRSHLQFDGAARARGDGGGGGAHTRQECSRSGLEAKRSYGWAYPAAAAVLAGLKGAARTVCTGTNAHAQCIRERQIDKCVHTKCSSCTNDPDMPHLATTNIQQEKNKPKLVECRDRGVKQPENVIISASCHALKRAREDNAVHLPADEFA